jgi:hypothetical protein
LRCGTTYCIWWTDNPAARAVSNGGNGGPRVRGTIQSGPLTRGSKTGKGNPYLKGTLGDAAAADAKTNTFLGERYRRIVKRRGKLKALVAVARSILVINKIRGPSWIQRAAVGMVVTVIAFLLAYLRRAGGVTEVVAYCAGVVLLGGLAYLAREAIANRQAVGVAQSSSTPGLALGLVTGALGTPWAPLPVAQTDTESRHVHLAGPLALAALSLALFIEFAWLDVPLTGAFAVAALIMTSSTLLPIKPLDGANLGGAGAVAATGVAAGAILVALGVA